MNTADQLTKTIQYAALDVLKEFQRVCTRRHLTYYAIGGTCIGAIRHKGFIPWDDDIDVAMPYRDYLQFIDYAKTDLNPKYSIIGPHTCKHYTGCYIKLQNNETTFVEEFAEKYPDRYAGIYIDIFPVHGLPDGNAKVWLVEHISSLQNKLNLRLRFEKDYGDSKQWKITWKICAPLRKIHHFDYYRHKQEIMLAKYPLDCSCRVYFCWRRIPKKNSNSTYKDIFFYDDFCEAVEMPFEDTTIMVPRGYDRYLKMDFGDYMKLPPTEQQVARHPKAIIDLSRPYKYYLQNQKGKQEV